ncbi:N-6 DNA methylase [Candidatus Pacearchaeota archaeon]|nr:N-6 DNA methylase [Candidatus Pacearchaeota archaeon]
MKNLFCNEKDLVNESAVEQFFIIRLLKYLGYKDKDIKTKNSIQSLSVGKGSKKELHKPDYVCMTLKKPRIVIDAKDPKENVDKYLYQTSGYSLALNQKYQKENPINYFILTNGIVFKLFEWDKEKPILTLSFKDFYEKNTKLKKLIEIISYDKLRENSSQSSISEEFEFIRPETRELEGIFKACHNLIWKKEKVKPTEAFFEFSKIFFVKLYYDREIHLLIKSGKVPHKKDFVFSVDWINEQLKWEVNPLDTILFKNLRNDMEKEIEKKRKKRIFKKDEKISLKPSTIKQVVELLEHLDLYGIDEDLNGRMFETFLNATVRGKDLGQFFTPRAVTKFMVKMADIKVTRNKIDRVLDGLCGSGGFLIEAMAVMFDKTTKLGSLSNVEKEKLKNEISTKKIWGADANLNISRIARMNMYLHGDGSNMIFWLPDFMDKNVEVEAGIDRELREEAEEFKKRTIEDRLQFDLVLTNPPFSMKYEKKKSDEKKILEEYEIAYKIGKENSKELRSSLKSNVLSIERYLDLLKPHGKLITVIDESVLNTDSEKDFRDFIKKNFLIKAVISLPRNTFVNQETNVKTSILYLVKKENKLEEQPDVFMSIVNNVGHTDAGKPKPELNELPEILKKFKEFENG